MTASNIVQHPGAGLPVHSPAQLSLIQRTVAKDCNSDEFNMFIQYCRALRLDPLRKQIYAFVFQKDNPEKRRMSVVVSIDGLRAIADRTGNYLPDDQGPTFETDPTAIDPLANPAGLVSATVRVKKHSHGQWHVVSATAYWAENAPMKMDGDFVWEETGEKWPSGQPKKRKRPTGEQRLVLDTSGQWGKMPRLMLAKVAEAQALRKAWPDDFANVFSDEEVARASANEQELLPAEAAEQGAVEERQARIGMGKCILFDFMTGDLSPLVDVPVGKVADRVMEFIETHREEPSQIEAFRIKNRRSLAEFWTLAPNDALEIKKLLEEAVHGGEG